MDDCLDVGYPKPISGSFPGLPTSPIDAVFQRDNGKIYFFVGQVYYRFSDKYLLPESDPSLPDVMDPAYAAGTMNLTQFSIADSEFIVGSTTLLGAFQRPNGKIYIFLKTGTTIKYYRITDKYLTGVTQDVLDPGYPKLLSESFEDITDFDTMFQRTESDQKIYWFLDDQYTRGTDKYIHVPGTCTACSKSNPAEDK